MTREFCDSFSIPKEFLVKLYAKDSEPLVGSTALESMMKVHEKEIDTIDGDMVSLEEHVRAYTSLSVVYDHITTESFNFVDKGNYVLYNEYIVNVTRNLGIKPLVVSQEAVQELPSVVLNHSISLEGLIGDMFSKIKNLFVKIYEAIKKFFVTYFTRLGRVKKKLINLKEVLEETDKDIKTLQIDNVPGSVSSKFPVNGMITLNVVEEYFKNISIVSSVLVNVNKAATGLANKEVFEKDFVSNIKNLRELAEKSSKEATDAEGKKSGFGKYALYGKAKQKNKELQGQADNLKDIAKKSSEEADDKEQAAVDIGNDSANAGIEFDDKNFEAAKKEFKDFLETLEKEFNTLSGKPLVNGDIVKSVKVTEESGVEIDIQNEKGDVSKEINLAGKSDLLKLINNTIKLMEDTEKMSTSYGDINDTIIKNMDAAEKIIKEIDAIKMESLGKYRNVLNAKVRERLSLMKTFFNNYNKVNKKLFSLVVDNAEGNIAYTVLSLKYFG